MKQIFASIETKIYSPVAREAFGVFSTASPTPNFKQLRRKKRSPPIPKGKSGLDTAAKHLPNAN